MAEFNPQELQTYYDIRNYAGAADYLENHLPANKEGIIAVRSHIKQLRKDAAMQQMMLSTANLDQQQAFNFINAINGCTIEPTTRIRVIGVDCLIRGFNCSFFAFPIFPP